MRKKKQKIENGNCKRKVLRCICFMATTSSCIMLSLTGIGLKNIPMSTGTACGVSISNKAVNEIVM